MILTTLYVDSRGGMRRSSCADRLRTEARGGATTRLGMLLSCMHAGLLFASWRSGFFFMPRALCVTPRQRSLAPVRGRPSGGGRHAAAIDAA